MSSLSTRFDPTQPLTDDSFYYVIGKRLGMEPAADNRADEVMFTYYGEYALNVLLETSPDGLIIQHGRECSESCGGRLVQFDPGRSDWTTQRKQQPAKEMDEKEWAKYLEQEAKNFSASLLERDYGNRHLL